jgi:hypothetical protein
MTTSVLIAEKAQMKDALSAHNLMIQILQSVYDTHTKKTAYNLADFLGSMKNAKISSEIFEQKKIDYDKTYGIDKVSTLITKLKVDAKDDIGFIFQSAYETVIADATLKAEFIEICQDTYALEIFCEDQALNIWTDYMFPEE